MGTFASKVTGRSGEAKFDIRECPDESQDHYRIDRNINAHRILLQDAIRRRENYTKILEDLMRSPGFGKPKYKVVDVASLIKRNDLDKAGLERMLDAFTMFEKYCHHLLKPVHNRAAKWHTIMFNNELFTKKIAHINGSQDILGQIGFSVSTGDGLSFPAGAQPDVEKLLDIIGDFLLAKTEITAYLADRHPYGHLIREQWFVDGDDKEDLFTESIKEPPVPPPAQPSAPPRLTYPLAEFTPPLSAAASPASTATTESYHDAEDGMRVEEAEDTLIKYPEVPTNNPESYQDAVIKVVENAPVMSLKQPQPPTACYPDIPPHNPEDDQNIHTSTTNISIDGGRNDGSSTQTPAPSQQTPLNPDMVPCEICGEKDGSILCETAPCDNKVLCGECDFKWHGHVRRQNHVRKDLTGNLETLPQYTSVMQSVPTQSNNSNPQPLSTLPKFDSSGLNLEAIHTMDSVEVTPNMRVDANSRYNTNHSGAPYSANQSPYSTNQSPYSTNRSQYSTNQSPYSTNQSIYSTNQSPYSTNHSPYSTNQSTDREALDPADVLKGIQQHQAPSINENNSDVSNSLASLQTEQQISNLSENISILSEQIDERTAGVNQIMVHDENFFENVGFLTMSREKAKLMKEKAQLEKQLQKISLEHSQNLSSSEGYVSGTQNSMSHDNVGTQNLISRGNMPSQNDTSQGNVCTQNLMTHGNSSTQNLLTQGNNVAQNLMTHGNMHTQDLMTHGNMGTQDSVTHSNLPSGAQNSMRCDITRIQKSMNYDDRPIRSQRSSTRPMGEFVIPGSSVMQYQQNSTENITSKNMSADNLPNISRNDPETYSTIGDSNVNNVCKPSSLPMSTSPTEVYPSMSKSESYVSIHPISSMSAGNEMQNVSISQDVMTSQYGTPFHPPPSYRSVFSPQQSSIQSQNFSSSENLNPSQSIQMLMDQNRGILSSNVSQQSNMPQGNMSQQSNMSQGNMSQQGITSQGIPSRNFQSQNIHPQQLKASQQNSGQNYHTTESPITIAQNRAQNIQQTQMQNHQFQQNVPSTQQYIENKPHETYEKQFYKSENPIPGMQNQQQINTSQYRDPNYVSQNINTQNYPQRNQPSQNFATQNSTFPSQNFPSQNPNIQSRNPNFPSQNPNFQSQNPNFPSSSNFQSQNLNLQSHDINFPPQNQNFTPQNLTSPSQNRNFQSTQSNFPYIDQNTSQVSSTFQNYNQPNQILTQNSNLPSQTYTNTSQNYTTQNRNQIHPNQNQDMNLPIDPNFRLQTNIQDYIIPEPEPVKPQQPVFRPIRFGQQQQFNNHPQYEPNNSIPKPFGNNQNSIQKTFETNQNNTHTLTQSNTLPRPFGNVKNPAFKPILLNQQPANYTSQFPTQSNQTQNYPQAKPQPAPKPKNYTLKSPISREPKWQCEHCTSLNTTKGKICDVCSKTTDKPVFVQVEESPRETGRFNEMPQQSQNTTNQYLRQQSNNQFEGQLPISDMQSLSLDDIYANRDDQTRWRPDQQFIGPGLHSPMSTLAISQPSMQDFNARQQLHNEGLALVKQLKDADAKGFKSSEIQIALQITDVDNLASWLTLDFSALVKKVVNKASRKLKGRISEDEARESLVESRGNEKQAIHLSVTQRKLKIEELSTGLFEAGEVRMALNICRGNVEMATSHISLNRTKAFLPRIWDRMEVIEQFAESPSSIVENEDFQASVLNDDIDFERRGRMLLAETGLQGWDRITTVYKVYNLTKERLPEEKPTFYDIVDAVQAKGLVDSSIQHLSQICTLCYGEFPISKIRNLMYCECKICIGCLTENFTLVIREQSANNLYCPSCNGPDLTDEAVASEHFAFLSNLLRYSVDKDLLNLLETKIRDWNLSKDPNFRWCPRCEFGFIFDGQNPMLCAQCQHRSCSQCRKPWEDQHEGLRCVDFATWKRNNDPEGQAEGLMNHLEQNGIKCPKCNAVYDLARGGCMHFTCPAQGCAHEFCSGCNQKFLHQHDQCRQYTRCAQRGLHCHHPRNCFFYLRDNDVPELQSLLQKSNIAFETIPPVNQNLNIGCRVMIQKEIHHRKKDEACGKLIEQGMYGLCVAHYKEHLVCLINKHLLDPVDIMKVEDMTTLLERCDIVVPASDEPAAQQLVSLREVVKKKLPLMNNGAVALVQ